MTVYKFHLKFKRVANSKEKKKEKPTMVIFKFLSANVMFYYFYVNWLLFISPFSRRMYCSLKFSPYFCMVYEIMNFRELLIEWNGLKLGISKWPFLGILNTTQHMTQQFRFMIVISTDWGQFTCCLCCEQITYVWFYWVISKEILVWIQVKYLH